MDDKQLAAGEAEVNKLGDQIRALQEKRREIQHGMSAEHIRRKLANIDPAGHVIGPKGIASGEKVNAPGAG